MIILGAGGHARVLIEAVKLHSRPVIGIVDADAGKNGQSIMGIPVFGNDDEILHFHPDDVELVNGIGSIASTALRASLFNRFKALGYRFATILHPSSIIASDAIIDEGAQIMAGAVIQVGVRIGMNSIINTRCAVDHDCTIGASCHLAPGVTLSGMVHVGDGTHIGTGAVVIQGVEIGPNSIIGAGSVVLHHVHGGSTVYGVPAREAQR